MGLDSRDQSGIWGFLPLSCIPQHPLPLLAHLLYSMDGQVKPKSLLLMTRELHCDLRDLE